MADIATLVLKIDSKQVKVGTVSLAALGKQASTTAKEVDKLKDKTTEFAGRSKRNFLELGSSLKIVGRDLSRYITLPFLAASGASLKFAKDLTTGLGQVETLIAGTGSRIYELQDAVTSVSKETGLGFEELTRGLYETISAFQDGEDSVARFTIAAKAAVAGNASVLDSVKLLSAVTKAYGDTSQEALAKVADLSFEAIRLGQSTFPALAQSITQVTANSARLGVSQEELFSIYATLTGVTGDAAIVSTGFNRALIALANPTKDLINLYAQYTDEQGNVVKTGEQFLRAIGGIGNAFTTINEAAEKSGKPIEDFITRETGVRVALQLAGKSADAFAEKSNALANSVGAMEEAYFAATTGIDEFQRILKQVKQTLATVGADIGQTLLPVIVTIAKQIADAAERFSALDEKTKSNILSVVGLAAAMGPLLIALGSVLRVLKLIGDLRILGASGALGILANPAVLIAVAAAIGILVIAMAKWYKTTKLQIEALRDLKQASTAFNTANTSFLDLIDSTSEMSDAAERNNAIVSKLAETYGEDFASSLDLSKASLNDIYQEMLKIEAFKFQQTLGAQAEQLKILQRDLNRTADELSYLYDNVKTRGLFDQFGGDIGAALEAWENGLLDIDMTPVLIDTMRGYVETQNKLLERETGVKDFFDDLAFDIEARTGGMLTLQRLFDEFGVEYTSEIVIIPKGNLDDANRLGRDMSGAMADGFQEGGGRLKTWADYFADITGIAGEAFAKIEYDATGNSVGFMQGRGKLAANAYAKAFADELTTQQLLSEAIGTAFTAGDQAEILEKQFNKTFDDIADLLSTKVHELNQEGLQFDIADLLTGDQTSVEKMLQVFGLADSSIKGLIEEARNLRDAFSVNTFSQAIDDVTDSYTEMYNEINSRNIGSDIFGIDRVNDAIAETAQSNIDNLSKLIENVSAMGGDVTGLEFLKEQEVQKLKDASNTLSNMQSELENASSLSEVFGSKLYEAFRRSGEGSEIFNTNLAAGLTVVEGLLSAIGSGLADIAAGFGQVVGEMAAGVDVAKRWDDVMGSFALSIAKTLSTLAIQVGMQLIGAGAVKLAQNDATGWALVGMGSGFLAGGLAGTFATSAVESYIATKEQNAQGGVYSGSEKLTKYAHGGVLGDYVNSIVDKPTYFANGSAVMGEAGAEAIMPLTRTSSGDLGVQAVGMGSGGKPTVSININNYASDNTTATATQNSDGSIDINIMKKLVASAIADGSADNAMRSRYGTRVRGLS